MKEFGLYRLQGKYCSKGHKRVGKSTSYQSGVTSVKGFTDLLPWFATVLSYDFAVADLHGLFQFDLGKIFLQSAIHDIRQNFITWHQIYCVPNSQSLAFLILLQAYL